MRASRFSFASPAFRFDRRRVGEFFAPRKPRHRFLRVLLASFGIAVLAVLLVFGLAIGAAMLTVGLLYRIWRQRGKRIAATAAASDTISAQTARTLDGEYTVLRKPMLNAGR